MELVQICDIRLGGGGSKFTIGIDGEIRMISLVGKERGYAHGSTGCVVVCRRILQEEGAPTSCPVGSCSKSKGIAQGFDKCI